MAVVSRLQSFLGKDKEGYEVPALSPFGGRLLHPRFATADEGNMWQMLRDAAYPGIAEHGPTSPCP
eukprot:2621096-Alexandrium_andersonii.AAC.1